jgi:hypothetical protein
MLPLFQRDIHHIHKWSSFIGGLKCSDSIDDKLFTDGNG